jgi:hypothetical protein
VWHLTVREHEKGVKTYYVLEQTCEVIGTGDLPLRTDWAAYTASANDVTGADATLLDHLKWAHNAEYDRGMSKLWLSRVNKEGIVGLEKRRIAERYLLACVIANRCVPRFVGPTPMLSAFVFEGKCSLSVSGPWRTAVQMSQEFAGLPERMEFKHQAGGERIRLFLPE